MIQILHFVQFDFIRRHNRKPDLYQQNGRHDHEKPYLRRAVKIRNAHGDLFQTEICAENGKRDHRRRKDLFDIFPEFYAQDRGDDIVQSVCDK